MQAHAWYVRGIALDVIKQVSARRVFHHDCQKLTGQECLQPHSRFNFVCSCLMEPLAPLWCRNASQFKSSRVESFLAAVVQAVKHLDRINRMRKYGVVFTVTVTSEPTCQAEVVVRTCLRWMMYGCAVHNLMLRTAASALLTSRVPRRSSLISTSWPVSSSLHR